MHERTKIGEAKGGSGIFMQRLVTDNLPLHDTPISYVLNHWIYFVVQQTIQPENQPFFMNT